MICDAEIDVAEALRRPGHDLQSVNTIRTVGVSVQNASNVCVSHELRELILLGQVDLAATFPQLRLDERKTERLVHILLSTGDYFSPGMQPTFVKRSRDTKLLVDLENFVGSKTRNAEHLERASGNFLTHCP